MPIFLIRNLGVVAYAQGFTLWHYQADMASLDQMSGPGFFDDAADMFAVGDMVLISASAGGRVLFVTATAPTVTTAPLS